jgi:hypothetical protein
MVCMKFDCGMDDHCDIQHLTLISFTLNTCLQYSMQRNCKRKDKKKKKKRDIQYVVAPGA